MMEFWHANQGQSPHYAKYGSVPGSNCTHTYHNRHQATHYPMYEQQEQGRESRYWTLPGSRTAGAPQEYTNWTDPGLTTPASQFPFFLDHHTQLQDLREYQIQDARDREWTSAQRAVRECERGIQREEWQRRWEPCSPVHYQKQVSKRSLSDSSYRELEAWAARYSQSLPRRRRIEAELRGNSQGLLDGNRAQEWNSGRRTDVQAAALHQSSNIRELGQWDRGSRMQSMIHHPSKAPALDASHMLDTKEKMNYQQRLFSQPPGYTAPPPYNSPHKSSPIMHHIDRYTTGWQQDRNRQTYCSEVRLGTQDEEKQKKEDITKSTGKQRFLSELEGHKQEGQDVLQTSSTIQIQATKINEDTSVKVIEGRKFKLNKKGGMTIFCLVSRIADKTESSSLPLCTSTTNIQNVQSGEVCRPPRDSNNVNQKQNVADEVDQSNASSQSSSRNLKAKQNSTPPCGEKGGATTSKKETPKANISNKAEADVSTKNTTNDAHFTCGRRASQSLPPVSGKYPLWKEPSFTGRAEPERTSPHCLKAKKEGGEPDDLHNQEDSTKINSHSRDTELRRVDFKKDVQSKDNHGVLAVDTSCVVVKMELIPSPKKEQVHYLDSTPDGKHSPLDIQSPMPSESVQSGDRLSQDVTANQKAKTKPQANPVQATERPETEFKSNPFKKKALEGGNKIIPSCLSSPSVSEKETLEDRAERILGIPLCNCPVEKESEPAPSCAMEQGEEDGTLPMKAISDTPEHLFKDAPDSQLHNPFQIGQVDDASKEKQKAEDEATEEHGEDFADPQDQVSSMSTENEKNSQPETDVESLHGSEITTKPLLQSSNDDITCEQSEEGAPDDKYASSKRLSQCLSPNTGTSDTSPLTSDAIHDDGANSVKLAPSNLTSHLSNISESSTDEELELAALDLSKTLPPCFDTCLSGITETSSLLHSLVPCPHPGSDESTNPPPLVLLDQPTETVSPITFSVDDQDKEGDTSQAKNMICTTCEHIAKGVQDESRLEQKILYDQTEDAATLRDSSVTENQCPTEDDEDPTGLLDKTFEIAKENCTDPQTQTEVNTLHQQLEHEQVEVSGSVKESNMAKEHLPTEGHEDIAGLEEELSQTKIEILSDCQTETEVNILHQQLEHDQVEVADSVNESNMAKEHLPTEGHESIAGLKEQLSQMEIEILTEGNILHQQLEYDQLEAADPVNKGNIDEELLQTNVKEFPTDLLEQTPEICHGNSTDPQTQTEVSILHQQLEHEQMEVADSVKESNMAKEHLPTEGHEDIAGLEEQLSETKTEIISDCQTETEVNILQQQPEYGQDEDVDPVNKGKIDELLPTNVHEFPTNLLEQTPEICHENGTDPQTETEVNTVHQQLEYDQVEVADPVNEGNMTEELPTEGHTFPTKPLEQTPAICHEIGADPQTQTEVSILHQQLEHDQEEVADSVNKSNMVKEHLATEGHEDIAGLKEQLSEMEIEILTEGNILHQQLEHHQMEVADSVKESNMTKEHLHGLLLVTEGHEDIAGLKEFFSDCQTETEVNILQQQPENGQDEVVDPVNKGKIDKLLPTNVHEFPTNLLEQTPEICHENGTDPQTETEVNTVHQQLEYDQVEVADPVNEGNMTEELPTEGHTFPTWEHIAKGVQDESRLEQKILYDQTEDAANLRDSIVTENQCPTEDDEDPTGLLEQTPAICHEIGTAPQTQTEVSILLQQLEHDQMEVADSVKEHNVAKEHVPTEGHEDIAGLKEQISQMETEICSDCQTETEVNILHQQLEHDQVEVADSVKERNMVKELLPTGGHEDIVVFKKQISQMEIEILTEGNILHQQLEYDQVQVADPVNKGNIDEALLPTNVKEFPTDLLEQTPEICHEIHTDPQTETEVNVLHQQLEYDQEEVADSVEDSNMSEQQFPIEHDKDFTGLKEQVSQTAKEIPTNCQTEIQVKTLQDREPLSVISTSSDISDYETFPFPFEVTLSPTLPSSPPYTAQNSNTEPVAHLDMTSFDIILCSGACAPVGISQMIPPHPNSCDQYLQLSSSSPSEPTLILPPSSTPHLLQEASGSVSSELPLSAAAEEESQYPRSLRDAVNRIRKHTAPDSENEDEEASDLWDPESAQDDLICLDVDVNSEDVMSRCSEELRKISRASPVNITPGEELGFDRAKRHEAENVKDEEEGKRKHDPCYEEQRARHVSCNSTDSHSSESTVTETAEDEIEEITPDAVPEIKTENDGGETDCSHEVKDKTSAGADRLDDRDMDECCLSERANLINETMEMMETEPKETQSQVL